MMVSSLPCHSWNHRSHLPVRDISHAHFPPQAGGQDHPRLRLKLPQQTEKGRRPREGGLIEPGTQKHGTCSLVMLPGLRRPPTTTRRADDPSGSGSRARLRCPSPYILRMIPIFASWTSWSLYLRRYSNF
jgi:hypothetical protein